MLCLCKISWALNKTLEGGGIKAIIYTDNGIAAFQGFENVESVSAIIRNDLLSAGFVINNEKSDLNPKTKGKWLGVRRDTRELTFTVPLEKITKFLRI